MKTLEQKSKFIHLRSMGYSLDKISDELRVPKPTLIKWKKEFAREIANAEYEQMQCVQDQFKLTTLDKLETLIKKIKEVYAVQEKQDLTKKEIKELILFKDYLEKELKTAKSSYKYYTGEQTKFKASNGTNLYDDVTLPLE